MRTPEDARCQKCRKKGKHPHHHGYTVDLRIAGLLSRVAGDAKEEGGESEKDGEGEYIRDLASAMLSSGSGEQTLGRLASKA